MLVPRALLAVFLFPSFALPVADARAAQYEAYLHCVQRERSVPAAGGKFETVVRIERYTRCYLVHVPRSEPPPGDRIGRGRGGARESRDPTAMTCPELAADIAALEANLRQAEQEQTELNTAVEETLNAATEARDAAASLRGDAAAARASCDARTRIATDERIRLSRHCESLPRVEQRECEGEVREQNPDLVALQAAARNTCRISANAQLQANKADSVSAEIAIQYRALDQRRGRLIAETQELRLALRGARNEQRARCPMP
jgi:chromosome segregation ATPase